MEPRDPEPKRWTECAGDERTQRAAELLRQVLAPVPLTQGQLARIGVEIESAAGTRRRWSRLWIGASLATAAALCLLPLLHLRQRPGSLGAARYALLGPGTAQLDPRYPEKVVLASGRLAVLTRESAAEIAALDARIIVRPGGVVEIDMGVSELSVAAYVGSASVAWSSGGRWIDVPSGTKLDAKGTGPIDPVRAAEVEKALSRGSSLSDAATPPPRKPFIAAAAPPSPNKTPARAATPTPIRTERHRRAERVGKIAESAPLAPVAVEAPVTAAATPPPESQLALETRLLGEAIRKLRSGHDASGALAVLDEYRALVVHGTLEPEVQVARIDALLNLGRRSEVLEILDRLTLSNLPRARELTVLRGELRAESGRCSEALGDFDRGLGDAIDELDERALYGRAACRHHRSDERGARADLERYLRAYPNGRFAAAARQAIGK